MNDSVDRAVDAVGEQEVQAKRRRSESGDTLVEVLLALVVLGLASVAILLAFSTTISSSAKYQGVTTLDTVLRTAAEEATTQLQAQSTTVWAGCNGWKQVSFTTPALPTGYSAQISSVTYWNGVSFASTCTANSPQLVTITVTYQGLSSSISTVVDEPLVHATAVASTATQLVFLESPTNSTAGSALTAAPVVAVEDSQGNIVTNDLGSNVAIAITSGTGSSGATMSYCSGSEFSGVVTFNNCNITLAGGAYTLTATDPGLNPATSNAFNVYAAAPSQLNFLVSPSNSTGGGAFATQPVVQVEDAYGNIVTDDQSTVSLAVTSNTGTAGAAVSGCVGAESGGTVYFSGCSVNTSGSNYTLTASDGSDATDNSSNFNVTVGAAAQLAFTVSPVASSTGVNFGVQPVVWVEDAGGNKVTSLPNTSVTLAISSGSGTLACTQTSNIAASSSGVATFSGCKITLGTQGSFTLKATASGLTTATSNSFTVAGAISKLAFTVSPTASVSGVAFPTQPVVAVEDSSGDLLTTGSYSIFLQIKSGSGTLVCSPTSNSVSSSSGLATFAGCKITGTQGPYTLTATSGSYTAPTSSSFTVAGSATKLAFITSPGPATGGYAFSTQPLVAIEDSSGDLVSNATTTVTMAVNTGTGTLSCSSATAVAGLATFPSCKITLGTQGAFTLKASASGLTSATSSSFTVAGPAAELAFITSPSSAAGGASFSTQPVVAVEDSSGDVVTNDSSTVTLAVTYGTGSAGASVSSACNGNEVNGIVAFSGCSVNTSGTGYTLTATDGALTPATSSAFSVVVGSAAQVAFITSPSTSAAGVAFTSQPVVAVEDAGGNVVTTNASTVVLAVTSGTGTNGATLSGCSGVESGGVVIFNGCVMTTSGIEYTLTATDGALSANLSNPFDISPGPASTLAITSTPVSGTVSATSTIGPITVQQQDGYGNPVPAQTGGIVVSLSSSSTLNPSFSAISQTGSVPNVTSVAIPAGASSATFFYGDEQAGSPTITTSLLGLSSGTQVESLSPSAPTQLVMMTQPSPSTAAGVAFGIQPVVTIEDVFGNTVTSDNASVVMAVTTGSGSLAGCSETTNSGVATFSGCNITTVGSNYVVTATSSGVSSATSSPAFSITPAGASKLIMTTQPAATTVAGVAFSRQAVVTIEDPFGNVVTSSSSTVALAVTTGSGSVAGCSETTTSGIATFSGCFITKTGSNYVVTATLSGLTSAASTPAFSITPAAANKLAITTQPSASTVAGVAFATQPVITIQDTYGNTVTTSSAAVALSVTTGTGSLTGCSETTTAGVAAFSGCKITVTGSNYVVTAASGGLASAVSSPAFTITPSTPTKLIMTTQPSASTVAGVTFARQPVVTIQDTFGNTVTTSSAAVALAVTTGSGSVLNCSETTTAGVATFSGCDITRTGSNYVVTATSSGLTSATSTPAFTITPAAANNLSFSSTPATTPSGTAFTAQPVVVVQDIFGNTVTTSSLPVTLSVNAGTLSCTSANPLAAASGVVTFAGCTDIDTTGASVILTAAGSGVTSATTTFTVIGSANKVVFTQAPGTTSTGTTFSAQPVAVIEDAFGNTVTSSSAAVTLSVNAGTLSCTSTNPLSATSGVATFVGCTDTDTTGALVTLTAASSGLTSATTQMTVIGTANKLIMTTQPSASTVAGVAFVTQPVVTIEDSFGNTVTSSSATVSLAVTTGSGSLSGCSATTSSGVATFSGCNITTTGANYVVTATSSGLTSAASTPAFAITPAAAASVIFTTSPATTASATVFAAQPVAKIVDAFGNVVTTSSASVTLSANAGTLFCTSVSPLSAVSGVATFVGCKDTDTAGGLVTLTAASSGLTSGTTSVTIIGSASKVVFTQVPGTTSTGAFFSAQPVATIEDSAGDTVTSSAASVTLSANSPTLACTSANPLPAVSGVATFVGCKETNTNGALVTLTGASSGLTSATTTVTIIGTATKLVFTSNPVNNGNGSGSTFSTQPVVSVEDAFGNVVTSSSASITLSSSAGTLACTSANPLTAVNGVATFVGCKVTLTPTQSMTLGAAASGLTSATSNSFTA
jgi:hypothetical protein